MSNHGDWDQTSPNDSVYTSESLPTRSSRRDQRQQRKNRNRWIITAVIAAVIVIAGLVIAGVISSQNNNDAGAEAPSGTGTSSTDAGTGTAEPSRNPSPGLDGIIAVGVSPHQFEPGDCLVDFVSTEDPATVIECDRSHQAQLIGRQILPDDAAYPGADQLRTSAEEFCASIQLTGSSDASIVKSLSHPSEASWAEGDRRVDCYVIAQDGGTIEDTLIDQPVVESPEVTGADAAQPSPEEAEASAPATAESGAVASTDA